MRQITVFKEVVPLQKDNLTDYDKNYLFVRTWATDTDFDDIVKSYDILAQNINYKIIVELLLLLQTYHGDCRSLIKKETDFVMIKDLYTQIRSHKKINWELFKKYINAIIFQLENINALYNAMLNINTFYNMGYRNNYVLLYRGFNYTRYRLLIDQIKTLQINDVYVTPTFLSTSILEKIAEKFTSNTKNIENNVLWCIKINPQFLREVPYIYFGEDISDINEIEKIIDTNKFECEILLNLGAKLKLVNKTEIREVNYIYGPIHIQNLSYTLYDFEFIGWDDQESNNILYKIQQLKNCLQKLIETPISSVSVFSKRKSQFTPSSRSKKTRTIQE